MSYQRSRERNKRFKQLSSRSGSAYYDENKHRFVRYYRGRRSKLLKHLCNKKYRQTGLENFQHSNYKKASEFWWLYD